MNARPQRAEKPTNTKSPGSPVEKRTPTMAPIDDDGQTQRGDHRHVGHHQAEQQRRPSDWGHAQSVEVAALDVSHECRSSGHPGYRKGDRHRKEERLVVEGGAGQFLESTEVDGIEEGRDEDSGKDRGRLPWNLSESPPGHRSNVMDEASLPTDDTGRPNAVTREPRSPRSAIRSSP